jgi:hypothetical protein
MKLSRSSFLAAALIVFAFTSCGPPWKVIRVSGPPSALAGQTDVSVAFDYSQMYVESKLEADWVSLKTAEDANYPATWADLKGRFEAAVVQGMRNQFPSAHPVQTGVTPVTMVVQVHTFKLGKFIPFVMPPTIMDASLVFQVQGQTTDEISMVRSWQPSITQPSVFNHIPYVGEQFGAMGARFLASKQP